MSGEFQVAGHITSAPFTLKLHRGDGMALVAMNWRDGPPPDDFVSFGIQYREPGGDRFFDLKNRIGFPNKDGDVDPTKLSTMLSPIQKFRWVHFPRNAELAGEFVYRVTPVFMNASNELSYGIAQEAAIELRRETYPGQLNITFTRGFVSSQAFVDRYQSAGPISTLLPDLATNGLSFVPTHPKAKEALTWMGFETRSAILEVLDQAIADGAEVRVVAYDLSEPDVVSRLEKVGPRLKILIDDEGDHAKTGSGENQAEARPVASAGRANVRRHHMGNLQHNKVVVVEGPTVTRAICGSTNFSWRGFFVQANNAVVLQGASAIAPFKAAFDAYWASDDVSLFGKSKSATWIDLGLPGIDAKVAFSPQAPANALLETVAEDIERHTTSCLFILTGLSLSDRGSDPRCDQGGDGPRRSVRLRYLGQEGGRPRSPEARWQSGTRQRCGPWQECAKALLTRTGWGRRHSYAPQIRRDRLQQAVGSGLLWLVQLLQVGGPGECREPPRRP